MPDLSNTTGSFRPPVPFWSRYLFAFSVSGLAWLAQICLTRWFGVPAMPFLIGFTAVIVSATGAGFGPGISSIAAVTAFGSAIFLRESGYSTREIMARAAIFILEGLLLCVGIVRLQRAANRAARNEDWSRRVVETASEGIWVLDERGIVTYANPRLGEITGVQVDELVGRRSEEIFFPEDLSIERIRFESRRVGMKEQFDRRLRKSDGTEVWVLTSSNTFWNPKTETLAVLSMMTDITERKNAEYALRRSEAKFRGLFENVLEGVYQSTPEGRIVAANPMLLRMLGVASEADLNDVDIASDFYVDTALRTQLIERLDQEGSFQNVEYELRRRDGETITVQENARVVRDEEGKPLYFEGTLTDITQKSRLEAQLREGQKAEALGLLANGIAHDFSNILTVISGYAHLVLADLNPSHTAYVSAGHLMTAADGAAGLTAQLLSFSRREMEAAALTELNWVVREAEQPLHTFLNALRPGAKISLILSLHPGPLPVHADAEHIRQILMNLTAALRGRVVEGGGVRIGTSSAGAGAADLPPAARAVACDYAILSVGDAEPLAFRPGVEDAADIQGISATRTLLALYDGFLTTENPLGGGLCFSVYLPVLPTFEKPRDSA
ncbi:MAG: PAS domain S-box protein [Terriglobia bacterium]